MISVYVRHTDPSNAHQSGVDLLKRVVADEFSLTVNDEDIVKTHNGKPYFKTTDKIKFNISHSGEYVVVCVSDEEIGVDIQEYKEVNSRMARRFFTEREYLFLEKIPADNRTAEIIKMWSIKEAVSKAQGFALINELAKIETLHFDGCYKSQINGYNLYISDEFPGYILVVATKQNDAPVIIKKDC